MALVSMSVLLTGSDGFVGSHLLQTFPPGLGSLFSPTYNELDLTDSNSVRDYLAGKDIKYCIHSATTLRAHFAYPVDVCELNLRMFFNLVRYLPKDCRIVNLGSGSEYSREHWHDNIHEEFFDRYIPKDPHSLSKYIISKFILTDATERFVTIRLFGIYGEREDYLFKFISNTIAKALHNIELTINQDVLFNYIDVRDFCRALYLLILNPDLYRLGALNLGHPQNYKLSEIASIVLQCTGREHLQTTILSETEGSSYTPYLRKMHSILPSSFCFTPINKSILRLSTYYSKILGSTDRDALLTDKYLDYAKQIMKK